MTSTSTKKKTAVLRKVERDAEKYQSAKATRVASIQSALEAGATVTDVASAVGVSRAAIYKIVSRARTE